MLIDLMGDDVQNVYHNWKIRVVYILIDYINLVDSANCLFLYKLLSI